ncbi:hypothetical protein GE09DRAFT_464757 [Coniochaeta sp. 2T2.1]|nr:hypothetical protein GE09DRAFT_464757 [Coniochaeta sp. 2T2.1]
MNFTMDRLLARKQSSSNLSPKRSNSATSTTPSDQKPREEKSAPYRHQRFETLLEVKGSYMTKAPLGLASTSQALCRSLLEKTQPVPSDTLFRDDVLETTCQKVHNKNEARVIQRISRLIVPSAESLATFGAEHLDILTESVNEGWNNSIPLTSTRPQPDYSVGFRRDAFTKGQLAKLSQFNGDFINGDQSLFMATYYMYFPFLTCEVKCGAAALDTADRQNAHSMTLAVRATVELLRAVKREGGQEEAMNVTMADRSSADESSSVYGGEDDVAAGPSEQCHDSLRDTAGNGAGVDTATTPADQVTLPQPDKISQMPAAAKPAKAAPQAEAGPGEDECVRMLCAEHLLPQVECLSIHRLCLFVLP